MENNPTIDKSYYCLTCKKDIETQDEQEECYHNKHKLKVKVILERKYRK